NKPILRYLEIIKLDDCRAKSITANLKRFILAKLLNNKYLVHFRSDSTSTILGHQNRVAARLKKYNSFITENYCIAHCLHFADQNAADKAATLLANINQTFEIVTMFLAEDNNLNITQASIFISKFASATITSLNNYFSNQELYEAIKIYDPKQLPISDNDLANYSNEAINILGNFYGIEKIINEQQFIPLLDKKDLINKWEMNFIFSQTIFIFDFPATSTLIQIALLIFVSNATV
ncbi:40438_t:CDS:2, partial [Gigaspora margarita]